MRQVFSEQGILDEEFRALESATKFPSLRKPRGWGIPPPRARVRVRAALR
jgi:hypothetical protein